MSDEQSKEQKHQDSYNREGDATHYDQDRLNVLVMMERIWGTKAMMFHCEITAFKYRMRVGRKAGAPGALDIKKATWYESAARYFLEKIEAGLEVKGDEPVKYGLPWK